MTLTQGPSCGCSQPTRAVLPSEGWTRRASAPKLTHKVTVRIPFFTGCGVGGLSSSPALGGRLPLVPCHVDLSTEQLAMWQLTSPTGSDLTESAQHKSHNLSIISSWKSHISSFSVFCARAASSPTIKERRITSDVFSEAPQMLTSQAMPGMSKPQTWLC